MGEIQDYKHFLDKGIELTNEGKFEEAIINLDEAINLQPNNALVYFSKAIAFHNLNQLQAAFENYSKAIELNDKMIDAYYNRAQTILANEKISKDELNQALKDLTKATELDEKFIDAHYYSAVVKKKLQDFEGAIKSLDKVLKLEPDAVHSKALKKLILQKYLK